MRSKAFLAVCQTCRPRLARFAKAEAENLWTISYSNLRLRVLISKKGGCVGRSESPLTISYSTSLNGMFRSGPVEKGTLSRR